MERGGERYLWYGTIYGIESGLIRRHKDELLKNATEVTVDANCTNTHFDRKHEQFGSNQSSCRRREVCKNSAMVPYHGTTIPYHPNDSFDDLETICVVA